MGPSTGSRRCSCSSAASASVLGGGRHRLLGGRRARERQVEKVEDEDRADRQRDDVPRPGTHVIKESPGRWKIAQEQVVAVGQVVDDSDRDRVGGGGYRAPNDRPPPRTNTERKEEVESTKEEQPVRGVVLKENGVGEVAGNARQQEARHGAAEAPKVAHLEPEARPPPES